MCNDNLYIMMTITSFFTQRNKYENNDTSLARLYREQYTCKYIVYSHIDSG